VRHVVVNWMVENPAVRARQWNWKSTGEHGGGILGNLVSHSLHYLEWFCGPIGSLSARLFEPPEQDIPVDTMLTLPFSLASGASGVFTVSIASFLGSGHRLEFYGSEGTLVIANPTADYMRGFTLRHAQRPAAALAPVAVEDLWPTDTAERRIAPVARLASRFLDAVEAGTVVSPSFRDGLRVQQLIDAITRSHASGCWIEVPPLNEIVT
jgi:predicted dehydrogenase